MHNKPYRLKNLLRILAILIAVLLPHVPLLPFFSYSLVVIAVVWLFLKYDRTSFADIGFSTSKFKKQALLYGVLAAFVIVGFTQLISFPIIEWIFEFPETQVDLYDKLKGNTGFYLSMLVMAWLIGGLYEEIIFRGFIFFQLKRIIGGKYSNQISFMFTSIVFGLYHLQLGPVDTLNAFLVGIAYHLLFLRFKGNLWYSIVCHGTYNSIVITLLYLDLL